MQKHLIICSVAFTFGCCFCCRFVDRSFVSFRFVSFVSFM